MNKSLTIQEVKTFLVNNGWEQNKGGAYQRVVAIGPHPVVYTVELKREEVVYKMNGKIVETSKYSEVYLSMRGRALYLSHAVQILAI